MLPPRGAGASDHSCVPRRVAGLVDKREDRDILDDKAAASERNPDARVAGHEAPARENLEELAAVGRGVGRSSGGLQLAEERFGRGVKGPGCGLIGPVEQRLGCGVVGEDGER